MSLRPERVSAASVSILTTGTAAATDVEIYLQDMLDSTQSGYCIDISGGKGSAADPADGLQGHTCYSPSGSIEVDQTFDSDQFADGVLYMTNFDVCAQVSDTMSGAAIELATCDGSDAQTFEFSGEGTIAPASATDMCLTMRTAELVNFIIGVVSFFNPNFRSED